MDARFWPERAPTKARFQCSKCNNGRQHGNEGTWEPKLEHEHSFSGVSDGGGDRIPISTHQVTHYAPASIACVGVIDTTLSEREMVA